MLLTTALSIIWPVKWLKVELILNNQLSRIVRVGDRRRLSARRGMPIRVRPWRFSGKCRHPLPSPPMSSSNSPGPSTPTSRKRSKWETVDDDQIDASQQPAVKKRAKPKTIKAAVPDISDPSLEVELSPLKPIERPSHSRYVPPRTDHPPLLASRSVYSYERLNQIEEGSYGVVFRARDRQTGDIVALKKLKLDEEKYGFPITALREINALIACKHDNVSTLR